MRIVYVHGRAQEGKSALELKTYWDAGLLAGYREARIQPAPDLALTVAPFYGDLLAASVADLTETVERGSPDEAPDPIVQAMVEQMASRAGIESRDELSPDVVDRGVERWEWVQGLARVLERRVPWASSTLIEHQTADVATYLNRLAVRVEVDDVVRPFIAAGPCVVVAHSLGTVVAYSVLSELGAAADVPLFVTLGSPLGLREIQDRLEEVRPLVFPQGVGAWFNASDERDIVALHSRLDGTTLFPGIENHTGVRNAGKDPHDIYGYLADREVARRIADAVD